MRRGIPDLFLPCISDHGYRLCRCKDSTFSVKTHNKIRKFDEMSGRSASEAEAHLAAGLQFCGHWIEFLICLLNIRGFDVLIVIGT